MNINRNLKKIKISLLNVIVQNWFCYLYLKNEYKKELVDLETFNPEENTIKAQKLDQVISSLESNNKKGRNNKELTELKAKRLDINQQAAEHLQNQTKKTEIDKYWNNVRESLFQFNVWGKGIKDVKQMIETKEMIK